MSFVWTSEEKKCLSKVLLDIMNADGFIDEGEANYMNQLRMVIGISSEDIVEAHNISVTYSLALLQKMSIEKKIALGVMMANMIDADNDVDDRELKVFSVVHELIGIPEI